MRAASCNAGNKKNILHAGKGEFHVGHVFTNTGSSQVCLELDMIWELLLALPLQDNLWLKSNKL